MQPASLLRPSHRQLIDGTRAIPIAAASPRVSLDYPASIHPVTRFIPHANISALDIHPQHSGAGSMWRLWAGDQDYVELVVLGGGLKHFYRLRDKSDIV
jgi:hypothetical protein